MGEIIATDHFRANPAFDSDLESGRAENIAFKEHVGALTDSERKAFTKLVREIAFDYADRVTADWKSFKKALQG